MRHDINNKIAVAKGGLHLNYSNVNGSADYAIAPATPQLPHVHGQVHRDHTPHANDRTPHVHERGPRGRF